MRFFKVKHNPRVVEKNRQAEEIKAEIVERADKVSRETERLNKLMRANGYTLMILIATGGDNRRKRHGH
jgi:hypothetical protein